MKKIYLVVVLVLVLPVAYFYLNKKYFNRTSTPPAVGIQKENSWPPMIGRPYPDLELVNEKGESFKISDFKGKVLLIEPVGMNCAGCQAFSGAHKKGPFRGGVPQQELKSLEEYFPEYTGGLSLGDPRLVFLQVLLYDMNMGAPTKDDARSWFDHFAKDWPSNCHVAIPVRDMRGNAAFGLIPGFQLVDKDFILRSDCTGDNPKENMWTSLFPMIGKLFAAEKSGPSR